MSSSKVEFGQNLVNELGNRQVDLSGGADSGDNHPDEQFS